MTTQLKVMWSPLVGTVTMWREDNADDDEITKEEHADDNKNGNDETIQ